MTTGNTPEIWDGHCWLEFGGMIGDISLYRTVNYGKVPEDFSRFIFDTFGKGKGLLCATTEGLNEVGLNYIPCYSLREGQINGLLNGLE